MSDYGILISGNYSIFDRGWTACGVYMASGMYQSQAFDRPIYVGSSSDIANRIIDQHIHQLDAQIHYNKIFNGSWRNYKKENFVWLLLEECEPENQFKREQYYLDTLRPFVDENGGFNIAKYAKGGYDYNTKSSLKKIRHKRLRGKKLIRNPEGTIISVNNIEIFARNQGLDPHILRLVLFGHKYEYAGWITCNPTPALLKKIRNQKEP